MREIGVGLVGLGNVGAGVLRILRDNEAELTARLGARVVVKRIAVRDPAKDRGLPVEPRLLTTRIQDVLDDPAIEIVCELAGGVETGRAILMGALEAGKHVVTANKAVVAERGEELFRLAVARGLDVHYEATVCGGIPILRTIREALVSDRIEALFGIVNGTTNFILSQMDEGRSYADALAEAQRLGFAEADPTLDVEGGDAAQKLCILAGLAFNTRVRPSDVHTEGITALAPEDLVAARELGYVVKLVAAARRVGEDAIRAHVYPAMIPADALLADVRGAFNAVLLVSRALGPSMLYGQGAGGLPTGVSVVSDVIDCCRNILAGSPGRVPLPCEPYVRALRLLPLAEATSAYYLRFAVSDEPGVLAKLTGVLGARGISIAALSQRAQRSVEGRPVPVVIVTHEAREQDVRAALAEIDALPSTRGPTRLVRIEDRPPLARG